MFYVIDNHLIVISQRFVWLIELSTPLERKGLAKLFLLLHYLVLIFIIILLVSSTGITSPITILLMFLLFGSLLVAHIRAVTALKRQPQEKTPNSRMIPYEIKGRAKYRIFIFYVALVMPFAVTKGLIDVYVQHLLVTPIVIIASSIVISITLSALSEYFLCTVSLPPGKKKPAKTSPNFATRVA